MKPLFKIICIVLLLSISELSSAEELIFFADDSYKVLGSPQLKASAINPVLESGGNAVLRISLANAGSIEELIPLNGNSSESDVASELQEELLCTDASDLTASLEGDDVLEVTSGPEHIESLPSGSVANLEFSLSVSSHAPGWHELPLLLEYEHQVDASVSDGVISPLYQPANITIPVRVLVEGTDGPLRIAGVNSDLSAGKRGTIMAVIENSGPEVLRNCTAHLLIAPPFQNAGDVFLLGDLQPGELKVAEFSAEVSGDAGSQDYQLACAVDFDKGTAMLSLPIAVNKRPWSSIFYLALLLLLLLLAAGGILLLRKPSRRSMRRRKTWPWS